MYEALRVLQLQLLFDFAQGALIRGRGQRDARHFRKLFVQASQFPIVGPEVMPPLRHAVRLVDREQRDSALGQQLQKIATERAFGCDIE